MYGEWSCDIGDLTIKFINHPSNPTVFNCNKYPSSIAYILIQDELEYDKI